MADSRKDLLEEWNVMTKQIYTLLTARSALACRLHAVSPNDPAIRGIMHTPDIGSFGESARRRDLDATIDRILNGNKP